MRITNEINFRNFQGDLFGGLTAAVVALPMALAFGIASGAGAQAGLWGAILVGFFAALFGGTPTLISEPTGPMTVIVTAVIAGLMATNPDNPEKALAMAFTVIMLAGIFQILLGVLGIGRYIAMLPYNVISGFMSGIGIILIALQIAPFLGQDTPSGGVIGLIRNLPDLITHINPWETVLGVVTFVIILFYPSKLKTFIPPQLGALVVGTLLALLLSRNVEIRTIASIGEISQGLPQLQSHSVKTITDADDQIILTPEEKEVLDSAKGRVLLFHLSGPMIFGVAKAISRKHNAMDNYDVLIVDLGEVPILGVTSSLAIENAIQESIELDREVIIVGATGKVKHRLEKLGIAGLIPEDHWMSDRLCALKQAKLLSSQFQLNKLHSLN